MNHNKKQQHSKSPISLKIKFSLVFVLFVVTLFSVIIYNSVQQIQKATSVISSAVGMPVLSRASEFIDGGKYENLARTLDENDPFFKETQEKIRHLREETQCLYLYTMARTEDNVHYFIFDGEDPESENFSPLGSMEDISEFGEEFMLTYETKTPKFTSMMDQSRWGRLVSSYMPILNPAGEAVGIIGIDFDGEEIYQVILSNLRNQTVLGLIFVVAGLLLYLYFFRDIERIYMEKNKALDRLNMLKSDLIATLSHEIRTPLTVMSAYAQYAVKTIQNGDYSDAAIKRLSTITREANRLARLSENLLMAFKEPCSSHREKAPLYIDALISYIASVFKPIMDKKDNKQAFQLAPMLPAVFGNNEDLTQVLFNLLSNAQAHTQSGEIKITAVSDGDYVTVTVSDTGSGIAPELLPYKFEKYRHDEKGTGYGLSICKEIIEEHGGEIWLESEHGAGTAVSFTLPAYMEEAVS